MSNPLSYRNRKSLDVDFLVPFTHRLRHTEDLFRHEHEVLADVLEPSGDRAPRVQFWVDQDVADARRELVEQLRTFSHAYADRVTRVGNVQFVPGGEAIKNDIHILERMLKVLHTSDLDRRSYVVVIGGGAVLDTVGFAAAIAHRGLRLVRIPTTTLAQADSGVGVKNGVNLFRKKNWIGTFAPPWAVINDAALLSSLSDRDFICGFAEVVKVALLKDAGLFDQVCRAAASVRRREMGIALPLVRASALWHLRHITAGGDPFEALEARPLDFGHWSAHKIESLSDFTIRHGEAVAIGLAIDTVYSSLVHGLSADDAVRVVGCLKELGFSLSLPATATRQALFAGLEEFRQHLGGRLTLTMLRDVGDPIDVHRLDRRRMQEAVDVVAELAESRAPDHQG